MIFEDAKGEMKTALEHKSRDLDESHPGYLQCYCDYIKKHKKDRLQLETEITYKKGSPGDDLDTGKDTKLKINMCTQYRKDSSFSKLLGTSVAFFIIGVNVILKILIIKLIEWISEDTYSQQLTSITNMVFLA